MPICHALTLAGHPCRGYGCTVSTAAALCHKHTDYFTGDRPDQHIAKLVYIFMTEDERRWILTMLRSPLYTRDVTRITAFLNSYLTSNTEAGIRRAYSIYEMYLKAGVLSPTSIPHLWKRGMNQAVRKAGYSCIPSRLDGSVSIPPYFPQAVKLHFEHFCKGMPPSLLFPHFLESMRDSTLMNFILPPEGELIVRASVHIWKVLLPILLTLTSNRQLVGYPVEQILRKIDARHTSYPDSIWRIAGVRDCLATALRAEQLRQRVIARQRIDPICEELMAAAWNPQRVQKWIEAGRWDMIDS